MPKKARKKLPRRVRTGLAAVPFQHGLKAVSDHFRIEIKPSEALGVVKTYIKNSFKKSEVQAILANPDWVWQNSNCSAVAYWVNHNLEVRDKETKQTIKWVNNYIKEKIEPGKILLKEKKQAAKDKKNIVTLSPHRRLMNKIGGTIMRDLDILEDRWMDGENASIEVYNLFKIYGLKGSAVQPVRDMIEGWLIDYEDAFHKRCEQAVEGFAYLSKSDLDHRIKVCNEILADLDRIKMAAKANRKTRAKKPKTADKQVAKLSFKREDTDYKIVSINPVLIIGAMRLFLFNTNEKKLTELVCKDPEGFMVSGTTVQNFDKEQSRVTRLRKPMEFLSVIQKRPITKIKKAWDELTTKDYMPTGRINTHTVILRVFDK